MGMVTTLPLIFILVAGHFMLHFGLQPDLHAVFPATCINLRLASIHK